MTLHLGNVPASSTLYIPFETVDGSGAGVTITGLATSDIEIYKNGSVTQRASDVGYALLDTDGIDFDAVTGLHGISIDLSDNSDAGFYAAGSQYWVVINAVTFAGATITPLIAMFRIVAAQAVSGVENVNVTYWGDSGVVGGVGGRPTVNAGSVADTGINERFDTADTGAIATAVWAGDTGLRDHINNTDTGLRAHIDDLDTGLHNILSKQDTGAMATAVWAGDTGLRDFIDNLDTGLRKYMDNLDTGISATNDTGAILNAIFENTRVDGRKFQENMRLLNAVLGGVVTGAGTGTEIFRKTNDTGAARVTATVDALGNRSAITYALDT